MKFFRQHITLPVFVLAVIETILWFSILYFVAYLVNVYGIGQGLRLDEEVEAFIWASALFAVVFVSVGLYNRDVFVDWQVFLQRAVNAFPLLIGASILLFGVYSLVREVSAEPFIAAAIGAAVAQFGLVFFLRLGFLSFSNTDLFKKRIFVIGDAVLGDRLRVFLESGRARHLTAVGFVEVHDNMTAVANATGVRGTFPVNYANSILDLAHDNRADEIVVAAREWRGLPIWQLLACKMNGISVVDFLTFWEREAREIDLEEVRPGWLALSDGFPAGRMQRVTKRSFDIVVSLFFLIFTLPLTLVTALLIKLESAGRVLYRQERVGAQGRTFSILKFRSMRADAEKEGTPRWAASGDDRITKVGGFIRKTRIDEIPQILNVLKGDMSLIGPRPERPYFVERLKREIPLYDLRHYVKPGITGWAQVNYPYGASVDDARRKLAYDLYYVKNIGIFLDLVILLQTVRVVLMQEGSR